MQLEEHLRYLPKQRGDHALMLSIALMAAALAVGAFVFLMSADAFSSYPYFFLLPWIAGLAVVLVVPLVALRSLGRFSFADPIVFGIFSYFGPAFVIGGLLFAGGWSDPPFLALIQDVETTAPFTITLIALGFAGLAIGYFMPFGARVGSAMANVLPRPNYSDSAYIVPGIVLMILGVLTNVVAFTLGVFGYQQAKVMNTYDGLVYLTTLFWLQGSFLLWLVVFRSKEWRLSFVPVVTLLVLTSLTKVVFAGNRGTIIQVFAVAGLAYVLSGRRIGPRVITGGGVLLTVALLLGMIYGTTFRQVKGTEAQQTADQYAENVLRTFEQVGRTDTVETIRFGLTSLAERVDVLSTLCVVVSNYEALRPYEEAYGLDNNIWVDMTTFFIPRVVWKDKPAASDPRKYSDLYFNYGETSFAITPVGDLLRNYGVVGVPIGMFLLGLILRFIYRSLVEGQPPDLWRLTLYFMLLISVSYEGFYGTIIPHLFKVTFTCLVGILIVILIARKMDPVSKPVTGNRIALQP